MNDYEAKNELKEEYKGRLEDFQDNEIYTFLQIDYDIEHLINEFPENKREYLKNEYNHFLVTVVGGEYTGIYGISGKGYDLYDYVYELTLVSKFELLVWELTGELESFFENLTDGTSQFNTSRLTDFFRDVDQDYVVDIQSKVWDQLQTKYNCEVLDISTDTGVYIVLSNDYTLDLDTGNTTKKNEKNEKNEKIKSYNDIWTKQSIGDMLDKHECTFDGKDYKTCEICISWINMINALFKNKK